MRGLFSGIFYAALLALSGCGDYDYGGFFTKQPDLATLEFGQMETSFLSLSSIPSYNTKVRYDFGELSVGQTRTVKLLLKNLGQLPARSLQLQIISQDPAAAKSFTYKSECSNEIKGRSGLPGAETVNLCTLEVTFSPVQVHAIDAKISVTFENGAGAGKQVYFPLSGSADARAFLSFQVVEPSTLTADGKFSLGQASSPYSTSALVRVNYNGDLLPPGSGVYPATSVQFSLSAPQFTFLPTGDPKFPDCQGTNGVLGTIATACYIRVQFSPDDEKDFTALLNLSYSNSTTTVSATLPSIGRGLVVKSPAKLTLDSNFSLDFGQVIANPTVPGTVYAHVLKGGSVPAQISSTTLSSLPSGVTVNPAETTCEFAKDGGSKTLNGPCTIALVYAPTAKVAAWSSGITILYKTTDLNNNQNLSDDQTTSFTIAGQSINPARLELTPNQYAPGLLNNTNDMYNIVYHFNGTVMNSNVYSPIYTVTNNGDAPAFPNPLTSVPDGTPFSFNLVYPDTGLPCTKILPTKTCVVRSLFWPKTADPASSSFTFTYTSGATAPTPTPIKMNVSGTVSTADVLSVGANTLQFIRSTALANIRGSSSIWVAGGTSLTGRNKIQEAGASPWFAIYVNGQPNDTGLFTIQYDNGYNVKLDFSACLGKVLNPSDNSNSYCAFTTKLAATNGDLRIPDAAALPTFTPISITGYYNDGTGANKTTTTSITIKPYEKPTFVRVDTKAFATTTLDFTPGGVGPDGKNVNQGSVTKLTQQFTVKATDIAPVRFYTFQVTPAAGFTALFTSSTPTPLIYSSALASVNDPTQAVITVTLDPAQATSPGNKNNTATISASYKDLYDTANEVFTVSYPVPLSAIITAPVPDLVITPPVFTKLLVTDQANPNPTDNQDLVIKNNSAGGIVLKPFGALASQEFSYVAGTKKQGATECTDGLTLAAGASCDKQIHFAPSTGVGIKNLGPLQIKFTQVSDANTVFQSKDFTLQGYGTQMMRIFAGGNTSCVADEVGFLRCWGRNAPTPGADNSPGSQTGFIASQITFGAQLTTVKKLAIGFSHLCAIISNNTTLTNAVTCWGHNEHGELGLGAGANLADSVLTNPLLDGSNNPVVVSFGTNAATQKPYQAKEIAVGSTHSCALLDDGSVRCWGGNSSAQLGNPNISNNAFIGNEANLATTMQPVNLKGVVATGLSAGDSYTCALLTGGGIKCWGDNYAGQLGQTTADASGNKLGFSAQEFTDLKNIDFGSSGAALSVNSCSTSAVTCASFNVPATSKIGVKCFGKTTDDNSGFDGVLGNCWARSGGKTTPASACESSPALPTTAAFGMNPTDTQNVPFVSIGSGALGVSKLSVGQSHSCVLLEDNSMRCWGANADGQLGNGTGNGATPTAGDKAANMGAALTPISFDAGNTLHPIDIAVGSFHSCAILSDNTAKCWGNWVDNADGQFMGASTRDKPVSGLAIVYSGK